MFEVQTPQYDQLRNAGGVEICPVLIGMDIKMAMKLERVRAILVHVNPSKEFGPVDLVTFP